MLDTVTRKARQLAGDPVLRRWLGGRLVGRRYREPAFTRHRPPYLASEPWPVNDSPKPSTALAALSAATPAGSIDLPLPGLAVRLQPGDAASLLERSFADLETCLAVHRFAWLPLLGDRVDLAWVWTLWNAWCDAHGEPNDDWPWHPYTAAERAVNILAFARRHGLPGPRDRTLSVLAAHGPAIARRLEYFGEQGTSNHLSNNGRGLFVLGLELGLDTCTRMGARILLEEAKRIFGPSGILREGSSHYHLLLTRNYAEAWLVARRHQRPEEPALRDIAARALAVIPRLALPGGLPLVGDISPDSPPSFLAGLLPNGNVSTGWTGLLNEDERNAFTELRDGPAPAGTGDLLADGWFRAGFGPWSGLWHAAPGGWSAMPGHGHQDCGGFELHFGTEPVFRDLGRGAYGESGDAAFYRSAHAHNTLVVDGADPFPPNKPYYDDAFRRRVGGPPPLLRADPHGVSLSHQGYGRLKGVGEAVRRWEFADSGLTITDRVDGTGSHAMTRLLHTTLKVERGGDAIVLHGAGGCYRVRADGDVGLRPATCWRAYGDGVPATTIRIDTAATLPWESTITVEAF